MPSDRNKSDQFHVVTKSGLWSVPADFPPLTKVDLKEHPLVKDNALRLPGLKTDVVLPR